MHRYALQVALAVPLRIGFDVEANPSEIMFYFEMAIDVYFWVDIVVQFRSGYYNLDKELIVDVRLSPHGAIFSSLVT